MRRLGFIRVAMMMVSLFAVNVFAEDTEKVAKIGDTEYATLQAAMTACVTGDNTITLLKDSAEVFTFAQKSGVNITIDGDGNTFSGKITLNAGGGNLTFTDAKIAPANSHTIYLNASDTPNVSFDHCVLEGKNMSGTIVYGYASSTENSVTVTNCTASNLQYIVSFRQRGSKSVLVENVTATNMVYLVRTLKCPSVTIKDVTCSAVIGIDIKNDAAGGKLVLENVNIDIFKYGGSLYIPVSGGGAGESWTVEIKGTCMFTKEGRAYEGNEWFSGNAGYKIVVAENAIVNPPLWIGDEYYTSLDEVISKAQDGDTIVLKNSITDSDANAVLSDKNITLDLNGYDINAEGILFNVSGHLTLEDSFEDQSGFIRVMYGKSENATAINLAQGGCFTLNGGNIYAEHKGVNAGNKSTARGEIIINGGSITTPHENVDPNSVECPAPIFINKKNKPLDLVINGGTLTGYYVILCDAPDSNIEITGGTLIAKGEDGFAVSVTASNVNIAITGGTFSHNIADEYCADGYICVKNGDMYTVEESPVAMIGDVTYATLQDAIDACVVGDNTITLLKDLSETVTIKQTEGINITIEGNGKYFSGTINVDGNNRPNGTETLTVQNVNFKKTDATTYAYFINAEKNAAGKNSEAHNLTVDNCTVESTNWHYAIATRHPYNLKVTNCTANKVYYFIYNPQGGESITVEDCTVTNATYGIGAQKCKNVYIKNYTYTGKAAGVYGRANPKGSVMILENVNITTTYAGQSAVTLWKNDDNTTSEIYTFIFKGENVLTTPTGVASFAAMSETNAPYALKLADKDATLKATEGLNVTSDVADSIVLYKNDTYIVTDRIQVTMTIDNKTMVDGNDMPELTYTLSVDAPITVTLAVNGTTITATVEADAMYEVTVMEGTLTILDAVASVNGTNYATLSAAIAAAKAGDTVTLLADVTEDVTFNKNLTLDGASFKYSGQIKISGNANVTIKNFDFDGGTIIHKGTNNTAKLTVQKCSFTNANSYAVTTERINNVTIEDCTVTNQSLLYAKLTTTDVVVRRVTVEGGNYVAHLVYGTTALFESVTATKMTGYGIFTQNYGAKTITVKNCSFDTPKYNSIAINETRSTNSDTFIFEGDNVMTSIENHEYLKLVLAEGATLTAPEGLTVTTNVADYKVAYENGTYFLVAKDYVVEINGVKYESIQEAINAAQDGDVITVIADHELTEIIKSADKFAYPVLVDVEKKVTIDLNGKTVTVNNPVADTKYSKFDLIAAIYVGGNGDLTLKDSVGGGNLTVTAGDSQIYTLLMVDGENTKMLIESGHYELDKTANQSLIYAGDDKTITVTGGTFVLLNANPDISKIPWIFNCYGDGVNSVTVTGGTYNVDPTHYHGEVYYPKGYMAVENADGTWSVVKGKVYNETYGVTYMTIADAMAHAMTTTGKGDDVIVLLENHTESVVLVYDGTVLDVKDKTLTADYLVVFKGGFVTGNAYDKDGAHGQIKINKDRVVITEGALAQGQGYMMPVWNEDHYVFGLIGAITSGGSYGCTYNEETDEVELSFKVKATTDLNNDIMKLKGYSDHGLKVVVRVEWMVDLTGDGVADALQSRNYVYTDEMVQACAGKKMYVFSIGVGDRQNMPT